MQKRHALILRCYDGLVRLYPKLTQEDFGEEMRYVFADALAEASSEGWSASLRLLLRELRDLPLLLINEYRQAVGIWYRQRHMEGMASQDDRPGMVPMGFTAFSDTLFFIRGCSPQTRRAFDVAIAITGILLVSPCLLLLPLLIKANSQGPIFYRQNCTGKDGQPYTMYKFRSMAADKDIRWRSGREVGGDEELRITEVGRWARQWNLDEMPQLFNVLRGDMSILGPRPSFLDK